MYMAARAAGFLAAVLVLGLCLLDVADRLADLAAAGLEEERAWLAEAPVDADDDVADADVEDVEGERLAPPSSEPPDSPSDEPESSEPLRCELPAALYADAPDEPLPLDAVDGDEWDGVAPVGDSVGTPPVVAWAEGSV